MRHVVGPVSDFGKLFAGKQSCRVTKQQPDVHAVGQNPAQQQQQQLQ
jgi:hypothetical protein